jgi:polysaccharide biosynthesis transport protein
MSESVNQPIPNQSPLLLPAHYSPPIQVPTKEIVELEAENQQGFHILDYLRVIVKRRWIILSVILAVAAVTAVITWRATPVYRATLKIEIDPEQTNILPFKEAMDPGATFAQSQEYLQTQIKVLASKTLADRVIRALSLESNAGFIGEANPAAKRNVLSLIPAAWGFTKAKEAALDDIEGRSSSEPEYSRCTKAFIDNLTVNPIRNSRLVEVSFDSYDARLSSRVVNMLAEQYIDLNFTTKYDATTKASEFLDRQLTDLKARVQKSEEGLVKFSKEHNIYSIGDKEIVILQKLADLNTALTAAQADRMQKESIWNVVKSAGLDEVSDIIRNNLIKELETNVANLHVAQAKLSASFKPGWPELDQVTGQLAAAESQLKNESQNAIKSIQTACRAAIQREKLLSDALEAQKVEANALNQNSIQYNILKRQVDTDKQLYDGLLQRLKEAEVSAGLKSSNIHVVDAAERARSPYKPNKPLNMALALGMGLLLGAGLAFFTESLDSSVKTPDDIDRYLRIPSLGVIPSQLSLGATNGRRRSLRAASEQSASIELITHHSMYSLVSEAYRNLRTSILLSSKAGRPPQILMVTSSQPGEGKTTTSINIGIALAQTGKQVILFDCDMRNPRVHKVLNLDTNAGMSTFLSGNSDLLPLIKKTKVSNLYAISAGPIPPNPADLIGSTRMQEALALLRESFSYIVIDTPPVLSVTDARILGTMVDGVILVVRGGKTAREAVHHTKRLLQEVHARIIGALLNDVDIRSTDYSYYSKNAYYGYGKRYGYGQREDQSGRIQP